jgi:hypothetical protein
VESLVLSGCRRTKVGLPLCGVVILGPDTSPGNPTQGHSKLAVLTGPRPRL